MAVGRVGITLLAASPFLIVALASQTAHAQNPGGGPPSGAGATIQSLANEVAVIKARLDKLESGAVTANDIVGTYAVFALGIEMGGSPDGSPRPARISPETSAATMTFRSDGTGTLTWADARFELVQGMPWRHTSIPPAPGSANFKWTFVNGALSIDIFGGQGPAIGAGARVMITGTGNEIAPGASWSELWIMVRLP